MGGRYSREKGKRGERQTVAEMAEVFGEAVRRGLSQTRSGAEVADVELPPEVPLWVEVKAHQRVNIRAALEQAQAAIDAHIEPFEAAPYALAVARDTGKEPIAAMRWPQFLALLKRWWELEQQASKEIAKP